MRFRLPTESTLRMLSRYLLIGAVVFFLDMGIFTTLVHANAFLWIATLFAYSVAVCAHFLLNRYLNFRNFDRNLGNQLVTYLTIVSFSAVLTLAIIEFSVHWLGLTPIVSKLIAVAVNLPVGFLGHRYVTFGPGLRATAMRFFKRFAD